MQDLALYLSLVISATLLIAAFLVIKSRIDSSRSTLAAGKFQLLFGFPVLAIISGPLFYRALIALYPALGFDPTIDRGESLLAVVAINLALGMVLAVLGRLYLGRRPIKW